MFTCAVVMTLGCELYLEVIKMVASLVGEIVKDNFWVGTAINHLKANSIPNRKLKQN